jgi:hypothetical protein
MFRIISGGQTGADRAALDAALTAGIECGGWCPEGRFAEDGPIAAAYPLLELSGGGYRQRTFRNIEDSDGTAIFYFGRPAGGTELTLAKCIRLHKPYKLIDAAEVDPGRAGRMVRTFVAEHDIRSLNIAGPRESTTPGTYAFVRKAIALFIESCTANPDRG